MQSCTCVHIISGRPRLSELLSLNCRLLGKRKEPPEECSYSLRTPVSRKLYCCHFTTDVLSYMA